MDVLSETSLFYRWGFEINKHISCKLKESVFLGQSSFTHRLSSCRSVGQSVGDCPELGAKLQVFMATFFSSLPSEHRGAEKKNREYMLTELLITKNTWASLTLWHCYGCFQVVCCCRWSSSCALSTGVRCPSSSSPWPYPNSPQVRCWESRGSQLSGTSSCSQFNGLCCSWQLVWMCAVSQGGAALHHDHTSSPAERCCSVLPARELAPSHRCGKNTDRVRNLKITPYDIIRLMMSWRSKYLERMTVLIFKDSWKWNNLIINLRRKWPNEA